MLKTMMYLVVLSVLGISLSGCAKDCPEPKIVVKYEYLKQPMVKLKEKPTFIKYDMNMVNFNGEDFYFMSLTDGSIMLTNWLAYKDWAEGNYKVLRKLETSQLKQKD